MLAQRRFGGSAHHGHDDHHGDDHGHHQHIEKVDPNHKFLTPENANKKFIVFNGLPSTEPGSYTLTNLYIHHNDLPLSQ